MRIFFAGKGGIRKNTLSGILTTYLAQEQRILVIDSATIPCDDLYIFPEKWKNRYTKIQIRITNP